MNPSKPSESVKDINMNSEQHSKHIHTELLRAKSSQKKLYILVASVLFLGACFILALAIFSNGTMIKIQPKDAQDTAVFNIVDGLATTIGHTVYSLAGNPTIEVAATGFRPLRKTLQKSEIGHSITLELSELPSQLHIKTQPNADNTNWFIDDHMVTVGAALKQAILAGSHNIKIDSPYYQKKTLPLTTKRGEAVNISVDLEAVTGQLSINTTPTGASVYSDGQLLGTSPLSIAKYGGKYQLKVIYAGYQDINEEVEITHSETTLERNYRLLLKDALLEIQLSPLGGKLLLDGKSVTIKNPLNIQAGINHSLIYLKDGYFSQQKTILLKPASKTNLSFHLKPETGSMRFSSHPSTTVNVDGKDVGKTPLSLQLSALPHSLRLHKKGYRTYSKTIHPSSKSTQQINVTLQTEQQARLAEAPTQLNNSVGIELKRFTPNEAFVMGAPRSETGQRANEFLRTVKLTMPFYISTHELSRGQYGQFRQVQGAKNEPMTSLSWIEAAQYCNWLSQREKLTPFYNIQGNQLLGSNAGSDGYRLPSEAEWEWLARKASKAQQSKFTWGDDTTIPANTGNIADEYAKGAVSHYVPNYSDGYAAIAPVGSFPADKNGLYDLTGNVSEWVHDVYTLIPVDGRISEINPLGPQHGDTHTVKGSNWRSGTITELRAAYREGAKDGRVDIGFRVARYVYGGMNVQQ